MGQAFGCFLCGCGRNRVVPLSAATGASSAESNVEKSCADAESSRFCDTPQVANLPSSGVPFGGAVDISDLSGDTSMATISLGSEQTLGSASLENLTRQSQSNTNVQREDGLDCSSLHFRRPGLWTPEPQDIPLSVSLDLLTQKDRTVARQKSASDGESGRRKPASTVSFSRSVTIGHTSPFSLPLQDPAQSSANVSVSSSRHARACTPLPRGPKLIKVQPCKDAPEPPPQLQDPARRVCKHGVVLGGGDEEDDGVDTHEVRCVKCERPQSKGGRMLQQLMNKRKEEKALKRQRKAEKKRLMEAEQERRRLEKQAIDNALQKFVDSQTRKEETK